MLFRSFVIRINATKNVRRRKIFCSINTRRVIPADRDDCKSSTFSRLQVVFIKGCVNVLLYEHWSFDA